jgi:anti-anti-sigma factor
MERPYQQIDVEQVGDVSCVTMRRRRLDEPEIVALGDELTNLIENGGCRRLVLSLGPGNPDCLYSTFLAKLVMVQRRLRDHQGALILCDVTPYVRDVFEACRLGNHFEFAPDRAAALEAMAGKPTG